MAYIGRFWLGLFTGPLRTGSTPIPALLVVPVVLLAAVALVGGIVVEPFAALAAAAAPITHGEPVIVEPAYHLDLRPEWVMACRAWNRGARRWPCRAPASGSCRPSPVSATWRVRAAGTD